MSLRGKDVKELRQLLNFWRELPYELLSVAETTECLLQHKGWKLLSPFEVELLPLDVKKAGVYVTRGIEVQLKTRPGEWCEEFTPLVFERSIDGSSTDSFDRVQYSDCFGSLVDGAGPEGKPSVRISQEKVLEAHRHCEKVLAVALTNLSIDPRDFIIFGTKAREMDRIPDYYCVDQKHEGYELPDLSTLNDTGEVRMLENVYSVCKQLEGHLSMAQQGGVVRGISDGKPPEVPAKIKELAEDIQEDQRLKLAGKSTRDKDRKRLYDKVSQRRRDNPDDYAKALEYIESQKPKV